MYTFISIDGRHLESIADPLDHREGVVVHGRGTGAGSIEQIPRATRAVHEDGGSLPRRELNLLETPAVGLYDQATLLPCGALVAVDVLTKVPGKEIRGV